jgi:hypothetical protein
VEWASALADIDAPPDPPRSSEEGDTEDPSPAELSAKLEDPATRQMYMRELVQKGQEKINKASRITTGAGGVADFILSAKEMVDWVLKSVPQAAPAALPWAGVCLGLPKFLFLSSANNLRFCL